MVKSRVLETGKWIHPGQCNSVFRVSSYTCLLSIRQTSWRADWTSDACVCLPHISVSRPTQDLHAQRSRVVCRRANVALHFKCSLGRVLHMPCVLNMQRRTAYCSMHSGIQQLAARMPACRPPLQHAACGKHVRDTSRRACVCTKPTRLREMAWRYTCRRVAEACYQLAECHRRGRASEREPYLKRCPQRKSGRLLNLVT